MHLLGGFTALVATYVLGPRRGRFHDEQTGEPLDKPKNIQGHNIGMQVSTIIEFWMPYSGCRQATRDIGLESTSIPQLLSLTTTSCSCLSVSLFDSYLGH